jgi:hypothetical protein
VYAPPPAPKRSRGAVATAWILGILLVLALGAAAFVTVQFLAAQDRIAEQQQEISDQQDEIEQQKELIDQKESFGAAMSALMGTAAQFDGVLTTSIVPWDEYQALVDRAWNNRWDAGLLAADVQQAEEKSERLEGVLADARTEAATNTTGSTYESVIDSLGGGFVRSVLDVQSCGSDASILGCVFTSDPYLVHFDAGNDQQPFMNDELRTGIAYHEFAHVLQLTNTEATDAALEAFGGDREFMADCFALTFLDGWTLDHRIWVSSFQYWDVSIGYGRTCDDGQRQVMRDWYAQLGVTPQTLAPS